MTTRKSVSPPAITPLGRTMSQFPIAPRYAKMVALGRQHGCLPYVIIIVAALSVREIFAESAMSAEEEEDAVEGSDEEEIVAARKRRGHIASRRRAWAGEVCVCVCGCVCVFEGLSWAYQIALKH